MRQPANWPKFLPFRATPNTASAPDLIPLCAVHGPDGCASFYSYVAYPSAERRGWNKCFVIGPISQKPEDHRRASTFSRRLELGLRVAK